MTVGPEHSRFFLAFLIGRFLQKVEDAPGRGELSEAGREEILERLLGRVRERRVKGVFTGPQQVANHFAAAVVFPKAGEGHCSGTVEPLVHLLKTGGR